MKNLCGIIASTPNSSYHLIIQTEVKTLECIMLHFAILLLILVIIPSFVGRALHIHKLFPIFFVQLLFGIALVNLYLPSFSTVATPSQTLGEWLHFTEFAPSFEYMGWLGIACSVALSSAHSAEYHSHQSERRFVLISILGFGIAFLINTLFAHQLVLFNPQLLGHNHAILWFSLAIGLSLSVTAVPVLVAIVDDLSIKPLIKNTAISTALLDDLWLWLGLGLVLSLSIPDGHPWSTLAWLGLYLCAMFGVLKPIINKGLQRYSLSSGYELLLVIGIILASSILTELMNLHAIFGIFIASLVLPTRLLRDVEPAVKDICQMLFMPLFFIVSGSKIHLHTIGWNFFTLLCLVSCVATAAKFFSVSIVAKKIGFDGLDSLTLGALMQCKGLMELVVANILLERDLISNLMFSVLSIYALISTLITIPMVRGLQIISKKI